MKYQLIVRSYDKRDNEQVYNTIVKTFDYYIKKVGLDRFESRLDVACLEIAEQLGYVFSRQDNELIFTSRSLTL